MYFFDLLDYYKLPPAQQSEWQQNGFGGAAVGCAGGPLPHDFEDYFGAQRATRDAFFKAVNQWFLSNNPTVCDENQEHIDNGCVPSHYDLWDEYNIISNEFFVAQGELTLTLLLHEYYYDWYYSTKNTNPFWDMTYAEYINYWVNIHGGGNDYRTGTTTEMRKIQTYCPTVDTFVPLIYNFGTSFTNADLKVRVTKYENAIKAYMCQIKKMMSIMDGDTFDEYIYDDNGNYNINKIGML